MAKSYSRNGGSGLWSTAANWGDVTLGLNPALAAPGNADTATIAGSDLQSSTLSGPGSAADAIFSGRGALAGDFHFGSVSGGVLDLLPGTTLIAQGGDIHGGVIAGQDTRLNVADTLWIDTLIANNATVTAGSLVFRQDSQNPFLRPDATAGLLVGNGASAAPGVITLASGIL